ncbi:hypothetical protein [Kitasatospora sp. SUK 42]|uniref:hypothetical protein n=1 Tax=Kitasatospora sp. SUK 42 TaxID=1588882 RepID=UPI0018CA7854|nr:hypothetical protein [Kitasatospora sp. SUK 42]MBV2156460.1 hypothetical protein [Kitasatospora sp. SUK 42]
MKLSMVPLSAPHTLFLGEDVTGWRTALLAALLAAVVLEVTTAVFRDALMGLPGLLLAALVGPQLTEPARLRLLPWWRAELSQRLAAGPRRWRRYVAALWFVLTLAWNGARHRAAFLGLPRRR